MKVVIISELSPRDWIVVQEIIRNIKNVTLIHLTTIRGMGRKQSGSWINAKGKKILKKIHKLRLRKSFSPNLHKELVYEKISFPSSEINTEKGRTLIQELNPDILLSCMAPILNESVFQVPKLAAINVHFGISPHYRGNDTLFWALYYQDYNYVGGCLHYISHGVDTGNILVEVRPGLAKGDGELSLDVKITTMLAKSAVQILDIIQNSQVLPKGKPQLEKGKNFKSSERTLYFDLKFLLLRAIGYWKVKTTQERIDFFI